MNRLNMLIRTLSISGNELAEALHVDNSLVSKWRNGKRELRPNSVYMNGILRYAVQLDAPGGYARLRSLMGPEISAECGTTEELTEALRQWLLTSEPASAESAPVQPVVSRMCAGADRTDVYLLPGGVGARQGGRILMQMAAESDGPNDLILLTNSSVDWLFENKTFLADWLRFCKKIAASGSLTVFVPVVNPYQVLSDFLLRQVSVLEQKNVRTVYIPKYKDDTFYYTILILRGKMALHCFSTNPVSGDSMFYLSSDPRAVGDLEALAESFLSRSRPMFTKYDYGSYNKYVNEIIGTQESGVNQYQNAYPGPLFINVPSLREILRENHVAGSEPEELYQILSTLNSRAQVRYFLDLDQLRRALKQERIEIPRLSYQIGKPIYVTNRQLRRLLEESIVHLEQSERSEVGLESLNELYGLGETEIIAMENVCVYYRSLAAPRPVVLEMKEMTGVTAVYSELDAVWSAIPRLNRNKEYCIRRLREILHRSELGEPRPE